MHIKDGGEQHAIAASDIHEGTVGAEVVCGRDRRSRERGQFGHRIIEDTSELGMIPEVFPRFPKQLRSSRLPGLDAINDLSKTLVEKLATAKQYHRANRSRHPRTEKTRELIVGERAPCRLLKNSLSGKCSQEAIQSRFVDFYLTGDFAGTTRTILQQVGHSQLDCSVQCLLDYETVTYPQQIHRRNRRPGVRCHREPPAVAAIVSLVKDFQVADRRRDPVRDPPRDQRSSRRGPWAQLRGHSRADVGFLLSGSTDGRVVLAWRNSPDRSRRKRSLSVLQSCA